MSASGWRQCLDLFAEHLAVQRAALLAGHPEQLAAFAPPVALGALPVELADEARALSELASALETDIAAAVAATGRELQLLSALHRPDRATASFCDNRV